VGGYLKENKAFALQTRKSVGLLREFKLRQGSCIVGGNCRYKCNKCVSRTDTNPPFAFQIAFPRGTDFTEFLQGGSKKLHTLFVSLYF